MDSNIIGGAARIFAALISRMTPKRAESVPSKSSLAAPSFLSPRKPTKDELVLRALLAEMSRMCAVMYEMAKRLPHQDDRAFMMRLVTGIGGANPSAEDMSEMLLRMGVRMDRIGAPGPISHELHELQNK